VLFPSHDFKMVLNRIYGYEDEGMLVKSLKFELFFS